MNYQDLKNLGRNTSWQDSKGISNEFELKKKRPFYLWARVLCLRRKRKFIWESAVICLLPEFNHSCSYSQPSRSSWTVYTRLTTKINFLFLCFIVRLLYNQRKKLFHCYMENIMDIMYIIIVISLCIYMYIYIYYILCILLNVTFSLFILFLLFKNKYKLRTTI